MRDAWDPRRLTHNRFNRRQLVRAAGGGALALSAAGPLNRLQRVSAQEEVNLKFMFWGSLEEKQGLEGAISKFNETHPGIKVEGQHVPRDGYETKINTMMGADSLPDIAHLPEGLALKWAKEGRILDLTPYLADHPSFSQRLPQSFYYYDPGKTIGTMNAVEIMCLYYNKDAFAQAGVTAPPTDGAQALNWQQFIELADQLTLDRDGRHPSEEGFDTDNVRQFGYSFYAWWGTWYPLLVSNGADITNEDGTQCTINSPEAVEVFQALQDSMYSHHVCPTVTQQAGMPDTVTRMQTGQVAIQLDGQWALLNLAPSGLNFGIGVMPKFKEPKPTLMGPLTAVFSHTEHPDEAFDFFLFHNDPEQSSALYEQGLWMPLEEKYYTDPTYTAKWIDNPAHPAEYKQAVVDYTYQFGISSPAVRLKNWDAIDIKLGAALGPIWSGDKPAQEVLDALAKDLQTDLQGKWPVA